MCPREDIARLKESSEDDKILSQNESTNRSCSSNWSSRMHRWIHKPTNSMILKVSHHASTNPKSYVTGIAAFSLAMILIGLSTNFYIEDKENVLFTPLGSRSLDHSDWIDNDSGFLKEPRTMEFFIHKDGDNVMGKEGLNRVFQVFDAIRDLEDYKKICSKSLFGIVDYQTGQTTCPVDSVTRFWNHSSTHFHSTVSSSDDAMAAISEPNYPDKGPVDIVKIVGNTQYDNDLQRYTFAHSYKISIHLPRYDDIVQQESADFEATVLDLVHSIRDEWKKEEGNRFRLDFFAVRSFADEFNRAILKDLPLVPLVFIIMSIFCILYFSKKNKVKSRGLLGLGAVVTVLLSLFTSYGLMFIIGVPLTSMTQILPFIMFGIGLDDVFVIIGEFERLKPTMHVVDRIQKTINTTGVSILLTTLTSVLAFAVGCSSTVPLVRWLCLYAFPTVFTIFLYSITFFVALIVLDERRMENNRSGCLVCCKLEETQEGESRVDTSEEEGEGENEVKNDKNSEAPPIDRFMLWYGKKLMQTWVKIAVVVVSVGMFAGLAYSTTLLEVYFNFVDVLPTDSYVADYIYVGNNYIESTRANPYVFFRFENQSDPDIQNAMESYIDQLVQDVDAIEVEPPSFWLKRFKNFTNTTDMKSLTFVEQMDEFLKSSGKHHVTDIVRDETFGTVLASRCQIPMYGVDFNDVDSQVNALESQRSVSANQPINQGRKDWSFFTLDYMYFIWEFYAVVVEELITSTLLGIVMVTLVSLIFMPHWSGFLFVGPFITILYIDLMGVLQLAQIDIGPVPYVGLIMSIGLMVDFIVHIVLRYFESKEKSREAKVMDTLCSMGASVFVGGVSTLLGVIPLAFSSTDVFFTIFVIFCGLVVLGMFHGLVVLPVILSIIGPTNA